MVRGRREDAKCDSRYGPMSIKFRCPMPPVIICCLHALITTSTCRLTPKYADKLNYPPVRKTAEVPGAFFKTSAATCRFSYSVDEGSPGSLYSAIEAANHNLANAIAGLKSDTWAQTASK